MKMRSESKFLVCRLCLSNGEVLVNIFEGEAEDGFEVKDTVEDLLRVEVLEGCVLPWIVCKNCILKLKNFSDFKLKCLTSNNSFIQMYLKTRPTESTCLDRTEAKEMDTKDDILRDPLGESEDCSVGDTRDGETTKDSNVFFEISPEGQDTSLQKKQEDGSEEDESFHLFLESDSEEEADLGGLKMGTETSTKMDAKDNIQRDPLVESEDCSHSYIGERETAKDLTVFCKIPLKRPAKRLNSDKDSNSSKESLPTNSKFVLENGSCQRGRHSYESSQSVNGPDDTAPQQVKKSPMVKICEGLNGLDSKLKEGKRPVKAQSARRMEKEFSRKTKLPARVGRPHSCGVCSKPFKTGGSLRDHMLIHTEEKAFKCNICSKTFMYNSYLRRHMLTHTGEIPFKCNYYSKSFSPSANLRTHMLTHTREKPFMCDICSKSFSWKSSLCFHLRTHIK